MTFGKVCGFESGSIDEVTSYVPFGGGGGTPIIQSVVARNNGYALRCAAQSSENSCVNLDLVEGNGRSSDVNGGLDPNYIRFYFRYTIKPVSSEEVFCQLGNNTGCIDLRLNSDGKIHAYNKFSSHDMATGSTVLTQEVWYRIEFYSRSFLNGGDGAYTLKINGNIEFTGTHTANPGGLIYRISLGKVYNLGSTTIDFYYDDFIWRDDAWPGIGRCIAMIVDGDGIYTNGTANGAINKWQCIDEIPHDSDTTYINGLTNTQAYTGILVASGITVETIQCAQLTIFAKRDGGTNGNIKARLRSGSTDSDTTGAASNTFYGISPFIKLFPTDPNTGLAWTIANIDNVEIGMVENSINPSRMTAAYLMVDYDPPIVGGIFRQSNLSGLGSGGPFLSDPLGA